MHPLIAFLAFLFSPSDDWLLRQSFELYIDPDQMPAVVQSYNELARQYATFAGSGETALSADAPAQAMWAEILSSSGHPTEAHQQWKRLEENPRLPAEMRDHVLLRLGETALADGDRQEARQWLTQVADRAQSPRAGDAVIDLLVCDLADGDSAAAVVRAEKIIAALGTNAPTTRAFFPVGLAFYANGRFDDAVKFLSQAGEDPKARYFLGLAFRKLNKPREALTAWESLRGYGVDASWARLAELQLAETYFALGDDSLCRTVCERAVALDPDGPNRDRFDFRLASLDMRHGDYQTAVARLTPLMENDELGSRSAELTAESLSKTGRSHDLYKALARRQDRSPRSAETAYQLAWAALADKRMDEAMGRSERGLSDFLDPDFTPRLLLLQGLVYEHKGQEAEALATYQTIADRFPASLAAAKSTHWLALAYARNGRYSETVTHVAYLWNNLSPEGRHSDPDTEFWIGEAHRHLGRLEDANTHFAAFLSLAPDQHPLRPYGTFERAAVLAQTKHTGEALALLDGFQRNATDQKNDAWVKLASLQRGNILFNDRQYAMAIAAYRAAGDTPKAMYHQAVALTKLDYYTDAVGTWVALAQKFPNDPYAEKGLFRAARTQFEIGQTTAAVETYTRFVEAYPQSALAKDARLQAAHALYNAGAVAQAAPLYKEYLNRYHGTEDVATVTPYLAACYARLNKSEEEAEPLLKDLPPSESFASIRLNAGSQHYNAKQFAEAERSFGLLAAEMPAYEQAPAALFYRAESLFQEKKWIDAEESLGAFLNVTAKPDTDQAALAWFHRGVAQFNQDKLLNAATSFATLVDRYPASALAADARQNLYVCYHNLGDWPTERAMRAKYGSSAASTVTVAQAATVNNSNGSTPRRSITEIPAELDPTAKKSETPDMFGSADLTSTPQ